MRPIEDYFQLQWKLCVIPPGEKGPTTAGWNRLENAIQSAEFIPPGCNIGLLHAYSGTCSIDIDDIGRATGWLSEQGVDLASIAMAPGAVQIYSGNPNHAKLLFQLPTPLPSKKVVVEQKNILDFRCGTMDGGTVQCVLPPSKHPNGNHYQWIGDFRQLPMLPDSLRNVWNNLIAQDTRPKESQQSRTLDLSRERVIKLLESIDPSCDRMKWIRVGMALHATGLPDAGQLFDIWSSRSATKYRGTQDVYTQWKSFTLKPGGVGIGSLYYLAMEGGWRPSLDDALALFAQEGQCKFDPDLTAEIHRFLPDLDTERLPKRLVRYAVEVSRRVGCNPIIPIIAGLVAVSSASDHRSTLEIFDQYKVHPVLWALMIADPGAKKSPGSSPMFEPLALIEREDIDRQKARFLAWEAAEAAHVAAKKQYLKKAESDEYRFGNEVLPEVPELPEAPKSLRLMFTDSTSQKVIRMLDGRPQGLGLIMDEAGAWLRKVTDPRSGEDRSMWTVAYESRPYTFDRVGTGSIRLPCLSISVYGNVQNKVIENLVGVMQLDGFSQRFMPIFIPRGTQSKCSEDIPSWDSWSGEWEQIIRQIYAIGKQEYRLCSAGEQRFRDWEREVEEMKRTEMLLMSPPGLQSSVSKFTGLLGRLSLVFHLIDNPGQTTVNLEAIDNARYFIEEFLVYNIRCLYSMGDGEDLGQWIFNWIVTGDTDTINEGEVRRAARRQLEDRSIYEQKDLVNMHLQYLCTKGILMELSPPIGIKNAIYAVNPTIRYQYAAHRETVVKANQERANRIEEIVRRSGKMVNKKIRVRGE